MEWSILAASDSFYRRTINWMRLVFFDLTCQYGMSPARSLIILICLIPYFALFYLIALISKDSKTGFWLVLSNSHGRSKGRRRQVRLPVKFPPKGIPTGLPAKVKIQILHWSRLIRLSFVFSLLSAFRAVPGNLGRNGWITGRKASDYTIMTTGWARTLSWIQCLISTYLLGLWLATTFSNPF